MEPGFSTPSAACAESYPASCHVFRISRLPLSRWRQSPISTSSCRMQPPWGFVAVYCSALISSWETSNSHVRQKALVNGELLSTLLGALTLVTYTPRPSSVPAFEPESSASKPARWIESAASSEVPW